MINRLTKERHEELLQISDLYKGIWAKFKLIEGYISPFITLDELYPEFNFLDSIGIADSNKHEESDFYNQVIYWLNDLEEIISKKLLKFHDENSHLNEVESKKLIHKLNSIINQYEPQLPEEKTKIIFYERILYIVRANSNNKVLPIIWNMTLAEFVPAIALKCKKYYKNIIKSLQDNIELNPVFFESNLTKIILKSLKRIQGLSKAINRGEKMRTAVLANFVDNFFIAKDESSWGKSESGESFGEPDIKIENGNGEVIAICEGININSIEKCRIITHINKIFDYDSNGLDYNYFIIFNEAVNFSDSWNKYLEFIETKVDFKFKLETLSDVSEEFESATINIKVALSKHEREGQESRIYHIFLKMKN